MNHLGKQQTDLWTAMKMENSDNNRYTNTMYTIISLMGAQKYFPYVHNINFTKRKMIFFLEKKHSYILTTRKANDQAARKLGNFSESCHTSYPYGYPFGL